MCLPKSITGATRQNLATTLGCLLCFNFGLIFGIIENHVPLYESSITPLKRAATHTEAIWVLSALFYGVSIGALAFGFFWQYIGTKGVLLVSGLLQIIGWGSMHFALEIIHLHFACLFVGISYGAAYVVLPTFIQEITEYGLAAKLIALMDFWRTSGILIGIICGHYVHYEAVPLVGLLIAMIFQLGFAFIEESPYYYVKNKDEAGLEKCLRWYRGIRSADMSDKYDFHVELAQFKQEMKAPASFIIAPSVTFYYKLKIFAIVLILAIAAQLNGAYIFMFYGKQIFNQIDGPLTNTQQLFIMAITQIIAAFFAKQFAVKLRRKLVLWICSLTCSLSLIIMALLMQLHSVTYMPCWLSSAVLWLYMFALNFGLQAFITIFITELTPRELRADICYIAYAVSWVLLALTMQNFELLIVYLQMTTFLLILASFSIFLLIFCLFALPETKACSIDEIQQSLGHMQYGREAAASAVAGTHVTLETIRY